jgi:hypothetical protein
MALKVEVVEIVGRFLIVIVAESRGSGPDHAGDATSAPIHDR